MWPGAWMGRSQRCLGSTASVVTCRGAPRGALPARAMALALSRREIADAAHDEETPPHDDGNPLAGHSQLANQNETEAHHGHDGPGGHEVSPLSIDRARASPGPSGGA